MILEGTEVWFDILIILIIMNFVGPALVCCICRCIVYASEGCRAEEDLTYTRDVSTKWSDGVNVARTASIVSFLNFWILIAWWASCSVTTCWELTMTLKHYVVLFFGAISVPFGYSIMLLESASSREKEYIDNMGEAGDAAQLISNLHEKQPDIVFCAECYHYVSDDHDDSARVVTHRDEHYFMYSHWVDVSTPILEGLDRRRVTKIRLEKKISAGDEETSTECSSEFEAFKARNRGMDDHMDAWTETTIFGFEKRISAFVWEPTTSWWMNKCVYWLAVILAVTWPYRWYFRCKTGKAHYTIEKRFYMTRPQEEGLRQYYGPPIIINK